jgi:hypothetical protein
MSARVPHPQAHVLRWIADGLDVQARCDFGKGIVTDWKSTPPDDLLAYIRSTRSLWEFCLAPPAAAQIVFLPTPTDFLGDHL